LTSGMATACQSYGTNLTKGRREKWNALERHKILVLNICLWPHSKRRIRFEKSWQEGTSWPFLKTLDIIHYFLFWTAPSSYLI
jgi:hypothetical protein